MKNELFYDENIEYLKVLIWVSEIKNLVLFWLQKMYVVYCTEAFI